jgi:predicted DNA-binding transcriptional regulator AlpA
MHSQLFLNQGAIVLAISIAMAGTAVSQGRRLIDATVVSQKCGWSRQHTIRAADRGRMPAGFKVGRLRRWDEAEIDAWILAGCPPMYGDRTSSTT